MQASSSPQTEAYFLPCSEADRWAWLERELTQPIRNAEGLLRCVQRMKQFALDGTEWVEPPPPPPPPAPDDSPRPFVLPPLPSLAHFFAEVLPPLEGEHFFAHVLPRVQQVALEMPTLFPSGQLARLRASPVGSGNFAAQFTRRQALCLVAHMFLCTLDRQCVAHWATYLPWYEWWKSDAIFAYLRTLVTFFAQRVNQLEDEAFICQLIVVNRAVLSCAQEAAIDSIASSEQLLCDASLCQRVDLAAAASYADADEVLEIDFAHHDISFGRGGTQEELLLGMSPESHILPLLLESVQPHESVSITNAQRVGTFAGFGCDVTFTGPFVQPPAAEESSSCSMSPTRTIVAMDATNMWEALGDLPDEAYEQPQMHLKLLQLQCEGKVRRRDLVKVLVALDASRRRHGDDSPQSAAGPHRRLVWTGSWGCNSFGGNVHVKFILQWMAASLSRVSHLVFQTFAPPTDEVAFDIRELLACAQRHPHQASVGLLARCLDDFAAEVASITVEASPRCEFDTLGTSRRLFDRIRRALKDADRN